MSELRDAVQGLTEYTSVYYDGYWCICGEADSEPAGSPETIVHKDGCPVIRIQAALAAHEAEHKALEGLLEAVLSGDSLQENIRFYRRGGYPEIATALESYQAATKERDERVD